MLFPGGATPKLGRIDEGTTVTDYDEEEIARQMTNSTCIATAEWSNTKSNLLDAPGFAMFVQEVRIAMVAAEAAIVVVDGVSGVEVVTEKVWLYADEIELPRVIVVSRMDRERANYESAVGSRGRAVGGQVTAVQIPIGSEKSLKGVVDLVNMKAYSYELGGNGKGKEGTIPAELEAVCKDAHEKLVELIAEGKDELMQEYFDKGTIIEEHLVPALHEAIRDDKIFPVIFASGLGNIGTDHLLDFVVDYCPTAAEHREVHSTPDASGNGHSAERKVADNQPTSLFVFKTANDPFSGRITYFKVFSGVVKNDASFQNFTRNTSEKLSHLSTPQGKNLVPVPELHAGDIGAVAKLRDTLTGDTLGDKANPILYAPVVLPEPAITFAIEPKSRNDEDKLSNGLHKLMEEDPMVRFFRDAQTKEFLIAGPGQQTIEVIVSKLKKRYHTEVNLKAPKVPYRETIRGKADVQGRHKKQSGGAGEKSGRQKEKKTPARASPL